MSYEDRLQRRHRHYFRKRKKKECGDKPDDDGCDGGKWKCVKGDDGDKLSWQCKTWDDKMCCPPGQYEKQGKCWKKEVYAISRGSGNLTRPVEKGVPYPCED